MSDRETGTIDIFGTSEALARALAERFADEAQTAQTERGGFYVALAGGTTPTAAYRLLATEAFEERFSWDDVYVYFGDERCVKPDDPLSNYKNAYDSLLSLVPIPERNIHRMRGEIEPAEAAERYAKILRDDLGEDLCLDLLMLGMGADGHTASLFPGADPLAETDRLVRPTYSKATQNHRLSITPKIINAARSVVIATEGAEKATALARALQGDYDPTNCPVQIVAPESGELHWLVDDLAAGMLKKN